MELDNKHIKILECINNFNNINHIKACIKDIERESDLSYNTVRLRLKDLENDKLVTVENNRRMKEIQLTDKGKYMVSNPQTSLENYTVN